MDRRDQYCEGQYGAGLIVLFDRKQSQEGKLWRCYRFSTLKQVSYLRGFAYDEDRKASGLFSKHQQLLAIQDDL